MAALNRCAIIGNIGKDPEVRSVGDSQVAQFSVAVTERWKNKAGEQQESTEWFNIVAWRGLASVAQQYLNKGMQVYVEGKIKTRSWEAEDGSKRYITELIADSIQMLGKKEAGQQQQSRTPPPSANNSSMDDDLPF